MTWTPDQAPVAVALYQEGLTPLSIAERLETTERRVIEAIRAAGGWDLWRPRCIDDADYEAWRRRTGVAGSGPRLDGRYTRVSEHRNWTDAGGKPLRPCVDCPLGYAAEMRAQGRCNGTPAGVGTHDDVSEDEGLEEVAPMIDRARELPVRQNERPLPTVEVVMTAPCGTCVHEPVCAIKRSLDGLERVPVQIPRLDPHLTVRLAADVDCSFYLRAKTTRAPSARRRPAEPIQAPVQGDLTPRQREILEAVIEADGDRAAAATKVGVVYQSIDGALEQIARKGFLPAELVDKLPKRFRDAAGAAAKAS